MFLDSRGAAPMLRTSVTLAVWPIQLLVDKPMQLINWLGSSIASHQALLAENATLHAQQILLQAELQKLLVLEKENEELRSLLRSSPRMGSGKVAAAQILAVDSDSNLSQVILDRGEHDGVYLNQPVLDSAGIVGQLIQVSPINSRVMLLTDPRSAVPAQITRNGLRFIVSGMGPLQMLGLLHVPYTADVRVGDVLVSSGLGQRFPAGYPVGTVAKIYHIRGEQFVTVLIDPAAKLNQTNQVLLYWPEKASASVAANTEKDSSTSNTKTSADANTTKNTKEEKEKKSS